MEQGTVSKGVFRSNSSRRALEQQRTHGTWSCVLSAVALSCGGFLFPCSELLRTGIRKSLGTVTLQVTPASSALPCLSLLGFSSFPCSASFELHFPLKMQIPLQVPLYSLQVSSLSPFPSAASLPPACGSCHVMRLLSIAPPGTLICCSFPYRLYIPSWGFVCMCVCDSIKQNTTKAGKTEADTDRQ